MKEKTTDNNSNANNNDAVVVDHDDEGDEDYDENEHDCAPNTPLACRCRQACAEGRVARWEGLGAWYAATSSARYQ